MSTLSDAIRRRQAAALACMLLSAAALDAPDARAQSQRNPAVSTVALDFVERQVSNAFADIAHMSPPELARALAERPDDIVLLDVRTAEEFAISRIPGAHRVDPSVRRTSDIVAATGPLTGKTIVAYCSIGLRSARLLVRLGQSLKEKSGREVYNLGGGIFRWRIVGNALVDASGDGTQDVHTYDILWRQLLP